MHYLDSQVKLKPFCLFTPLSIIIIVIIKLNTVFSFDKGIHKHDPTKYKAPIYSFGTRPNLANSDCSPGPRYLVPSNITRVGRDGTPAFSLFSRPKELGQFQIPGPGQKKKKKKKPLDITMDVLKSRWRNNILL